MTEHMEPPAKMFKDKLTYKKPVACFSRRKEKKDGKQRKEAQRVRIRIRAVQRIDFSWMTWKNICKKKKYVKKKVKYAILLSRLITDFLKIPD